MEHFSKSMIWTFSVFQMVRFQNDRFWNYFSQVNYLVMFFRFFEVWGPRRSKFKTFLMNRCDNALFQKFLMNRCDNTLFQKRNRKFETDNLSNFHFRFLRNETGHLKKTTSQLIFPVSFRLRTVACQNPKYQFQGFEICSIFPLVLAMHISNTLATH
jgi:hypothetical protein